jgi:dGTPase
VFPLAENDYVRTRLTHSLEVASVARSLGTLAGAVICDRHEIRDFHASDFGAICSSAALAHDLGNPPFGHSGEDAIRDWFRASAVAADAAADLTDEERLDFERYEGNAQGFRTVTRLQMPDNHGGLQLTCATLGAFTKYPVSAAVCVSRATGGASTKKFGFFREELPLFAEVAERTGLTPAGPEQWHRHPLVFLVEAADDISYRLVDLEDGFRMGHLEFEAVRERMMAVIGCAEKAAGLVRIRSRKEQIEYLRTMAIGEAVTQCAAAFCDQETAILEGRFDLPLLDVIPAGPALAEIRQFSTGTIYATPRGVAIEAAGYEVLGGILDILVAAVTDHARNRSPSRRSVKMLQLLPEQFLGPDRSPDASSYRRLLRLTDFVAGMTDSYAVNLYKRLRGITLPGE